jgi:Regulator of chromosome condensation (RCC1) repeat/IPT/TIG domain
MSCNPKHFLAGWTLVVLVMVFTLAMATASPASATSFGATGWGLNPPGGLGEICFGNTQCYTSPKEVNGLSGVSSVSAGGGQNLVLLSNGTVWAWGHRPNQAVFGPEAVKGLGGVTAISSGSGNGTSLALLEDGTVLTFGSDGGTPQPVSGLSNVTSISSGGDHSLALLSNGTVMAWGLNGSGQLGDGTTEGPETCGFINGEPLYCSRTPVPVSGLSNVTAISAGGNHSLALLKNGAVEAWGANSNGQLGTGTTSGSDVPVAVSGLSEVTAVSAGSEFSLALLGNQAVKAWGFNEFGQLGDGIECPAGNDCHSDVPEAVGELNGVTAISAGSQHALALLTNHTIKAWGYGRLGALGDRSTALAPRPVPVFGLREVSGISAGPGDSLAYGPPIPTVTNATPLEGPEGGGTEVTITGINFAEATEVDFGSAAAASFEVTSPTSINAVSPAGVGAQNVTVGNSAGTDVFFYPFRYRPPPVITKRVPGTGPATGGTTVKIYGTNFVFVSAVKFGSLDASSFTVGAKTITAVAPAQAAGTVDITVTTTGGTSALTKMDTFKYLPTVTGLSPNTGSKAGGTSVTVTGAGFVLGATATVFKFGTAKAKSVECTSTTTCTLTAPAHAVGTVDVKATVNKLSSAKNAPADRYSYN